jgi:hypothetical protein
LSANLPGNLDAIARLKFGIFSSSGLDVFEPVENGRELSVSARAGDLDVTLLARRPAGGEDCLKQRNAGLERFLAWVIYAAADVVKLLRFIRDRKIGTVFRDSG